MWEIEAVVRSILWQLAAKDYDGLIRRFPRSPTTADELRIAIEEYGRTVIPPPTEGYDKLISKYGGEEPDDPVFAIDAPVWTKEEGRSDLTLQLEIIYDTGEPVFIIADLHVL